MKSPSFQKKEKKKEVHQQYYSATSLLRTGLVFICRCHKYLEKPFPTEFWQKTAAVMLSTKSDCVFVGFILYVSGTNDFSYNANVGEA